MAKNRSIERNRMKYLAQVKARPRVLQFNNGYMKASQANSKDHIPNDARSLFEYRKRAIIANDGYKEAFLTAVLDAMFPNYSNPVPKVREPEALRLMINRMEPVERKMLILNSKYIKAAVLANHALDCIEVIEYQTLPGLLRRSITYNNLDRARHVYELKTIRWKTVICIPNVEPLPLDVDT